MLDHLAPREKFTLGFVPVLKAKTGDDGKRRLSGVASSTIQDRHGDVMTRSALEDMLASANRGLTIFLNHSYNVPEDVAGTVERASLRQATGDIHDLAVDIVINDTNPRAVAAWDAIQSGTQLGLSIGAMIPDGGAKVDRKTGSYTIEHVDLVETSIVGVPANPRSWVEYAAKALRKAATPTPDVTSIERTLVVPVAENADGAAFLDKSSEPEEAEEAPETPETVTEIYEAEAAAPEETRSIEELLALASAVAPLTPDAQDATVSIETPFANITVDTGNRGSSSSAGAASQEAPPSEPETESETAADAPPPWMGIPGNPPVQQSAFDTEFGPLINASLAQSAQLIASLSRELSEARLALTVVEGERVTAVRARDEAHEDLTKVLRETDSLMKRLASTPVGKRTNYHEAVGRFEAIRSVYGDEFTERLARSTTT